MEVWEPPPSTGQSGTGRVGPGLIHPCLQPLAQATNMLVERRGVLGVTFSFIPYCGVHWDNTK